MLAHERAHEGRHDILVSALALLSHCVFWFNPLMYLALRWLRHDQELACDEQVLSSLPRSEPEARRIYADALLKAQLATEGAWRMPIGCHWHRLTPKERKPPCSKSFARSGPPCCGHHACTRSCVFAGYVAWAGNYRRGSRVGGSQGNHHRWTNQDIDVRDAYSCTRAKKIKGKDARALDYACTTVSTRHRRAAN